MEDRTLIVMETGELFYYGVHFDDKKRAYSKKFR